MIASKKNGDIKICLDPRPLNKAIKRQRHIIFNLAGAKYFTILDVKCGYWQVPLDCESSKLTTFSTIFGNYKFLRHPFGLNVSQDVFQKRNRRSVERTSQTWCYVSQDASPYFRSETEEALKGLPKLGVIVHDILLWADTKKEALENIRKTLDRCREVGIRLNLAKCKFYVQEVKYFGHIINQNSIYFTRPRQN